MCNARHDRLGIAVANTQRPAEQSRPAGSNTLFVAWENLNTLTHADDPA